MVLLVDDTHIPTIRRMFEILAADAMWDVEDAAREPSGTLRADRSIPP